MALTNGEATDVNTVLRYFLHIPNVSGEVPSEDHAQAAAERLADKANNKLWAGIRAQDIRQAWQPGEPQRAEEKA